MNDALSTDDVKLAATFLVFGASHRKDTPVYRAREFELEELKVAGASHRTPVHKDIVIYYVEGLDIGQARAIKEAFDGKDGSEKFHAFVNALELEPDERRELLTLHSNALAQTCREAQEQREFWEWLDRDESAGGFRPEGTVWIKITKGERFIVLPGNVAPKTRLEFLHKLEQR
jgi:GrpB-like predicted nucleotidyltransferase (UPF0157 family)